MAFRIRRRRRAFHAYGVGTAKSGTNSLCELCRPHYRVAHEPQCETLIPLILRRQGDLNDCDEARAFVREAASAFDMNSSQLNYYLLPAILRECPDALFILTIRDCVSWVESLIHHILTRPVDPSSPWVAFRTFRWGACTAHPPEEQVLADAGVAPLSGYLDYWSNHNRSIISSVPESRLLIVRTDQLSNRVDRVAEFLNVPQRMLTASSAHSYASGRQPGVWLNRIDRDYLRQKVRYHCAPLMTQFFDDVLQAM
jgi:Sulfotransferase domain